jgi:hypothetical protein
MEFPLARQSDADREALWRETEAREEPAAETGACRLCFEGMDFRADRQRMTATVSVSSGGQTYAGTAELARGMLAGRGGMMAQAAVEALNACLGRPEFQLVDVARAQAGGQPLTLALLHYGRHNQLLPGCVLTGEDGDSAAVQAVLDAANRLVGRHRR